MKNYADGIREVHMECSSYDQQGRMIGATNRVHALLDVILSSGEERVAVVYHEDEAASIVCVDVRDSMPSYAEVRGLISNPKAKDITTVLSL